MYRALNHIQSVTVAGLVCLACNAQAATDVYLFGGQSNMTQGIVDGFVAEMQSIDPSATIATSRYRNDGRGLDSGWDNQTWLGDPPGAGRSTFYAGTGSTDANIGTAYSAMLSTWQSTLASISGAYEIKGLFWVHGEQDTKNTISVNRYADSLDNLVTRLHDDLGLTQGSVQFYYSSMETRLDDRFTYHEQLRSQQAAADKDSGNALSIANANLIDASGLVFTDGVHYDTNSQTQLGERFAAAVPEPTSLSLLAAGGWLLLRRRRA